MKESKLKVRSWTKDGWSTQLQEVSVTKTPRPFHEISNYENQNYGLYALLANINDKIQAGNPATEVDALPQNIRRIYEENNRIFLGDYGVYRKLDAEEQVYDNNEYGIYEEDADDFVNNTNIQDSLFAEENHMYERQESILNTAEDDENDILHVMTEEQMRGSINQDYITNVIESGDTNGYNIPKERVETVEKKYYNTSVISSYNREETFKELFDKICFCKSKRDLYGTPEDNPDGSVTFSGGLLESIREYYNKDKELISKWSDESKQAAKKAFIKDFRAKRKDSNSSVYNEEKLRRILYMKFDKPSQTHSITADNNKVIETKSSQGSEWDINKTKAYNELYLTKAQWNAIYKMKDIIVDRINMNYQENDNRDLVIQELREGWKLIKTREDLLDYISMAVHRDWKYTKTRVNSIYIDEKGIERKKFSSQNTYEFTLSKMDQISIKDEFKWKQGIRKMGKALGHYSIPVKYNTKNGKNKKEFSAKITSLVRDKIKMLEASKNYNKDKSMIHRLIKDYNLDISIN